MSKTKIRTKTRTTTKPPAESASPLEKVDRMLREGVATLDRHVRRTNVKVMTPREAEAHASLVLDLVRLRAVLLETERS